MKEQTITVTEASRNFADCVNRAYYQGTTFVITKNGVPFAKISPPAEKHCTGKDLSKALKDFALNRQERKAFAGDLKKGFKTLKRPEDLWG
jgi:prevent-host-death family protein